MAGARLSDCYDFMNDGARCGVRIRYGFRLSAQNSGSSRPTRTSTKIASGSYEDPETLVRGLRNLDPAALEKLADSLAIRL